MGKLGTRLLDGAKTEIKSPETVGVEVFIYSSRTELSTEDVLELLQVKGFTPADRPGDLQPRIIDVSGGLSNALEMFAEFSKPDLMSESTLAVPAGSQWVVSATRSMPYAMQTTTETDLNGSTRVQVKNGKIRFGITLYLEPAVNREGGVTLTCHRQVTRPVETEQAATGSGLTQVAQTFSSVKGFMKADDAFVHAEFVQAENPTPGFSGEVIVTLISAKVVG